MIGSADDYNGELKMKTEAQIRAVIDRLLHEKDLSGDKMHSATSEAEKELIRTENFARDRELITLDWVLSR